jgi:hypothetical protein
MRTLVAAAAMLVAVLAAAPAGARVVETVPATAGLRLAYEGIPLVADANGRVDVPAPDETSLRAGLRMLDTAVRPGVRARPAGWRHGVLTIQLEHRVRFAFRDPARRMIDRGRIASVTLKGPDGERRTLDASERHWLPGNRIVTLGQTVLSRQVTWAFDRVVAGGVNVVARAQQRFAPGRRDPVRVVVRLHTLRFAARDALLGSPIGTDIHVRHPDGHLTRHRLERGETVLRGLPAGDYRIRVTAPSMGTSWPVALSRDQRVEVSVISYADIALVLGVLALLAVGLVLAGRPRLRARLRRRAAA